MPAHRTRRNVRTSVTADLGRTLTTKNKLKANIKYLMVFGAKLSFVVAIAGELVNYDLRTCGSLSFPPSLLFSLSRSLSHVEFFYTDS